jgi:hypothetical protein
MIAHARGRAQHTGAAPVARQPGEQSRSCQMSGSLLAHYRGRLSALHSLTHACKKVAVHSADVAERYCTSPAGGTLALPLGQELPFGQGASHTMPHLRML